MCFELGVWNQPVFYSEQVERICPAKDTRAQTCKIPEEYKCENKRLKLENGLLRDFLRFSGSET